MLSERKIYLILIALGGVLTYGSAQTSILQGTINAYARVDTIYCFDENDVDSVVVESAADFSVGDTVLLYCPQGATIDMLTEDGRDAQLPGNAGRYAFLIADTVIGSPGNLVVFNTTVKPDIKPLEAGETAQLIRVPSYEKARVLAGGVTAPGWNGSTGGVVALFVRTTLELQGDINVTGKGLRGASWKAAYTGDCSSSDPDLYDSTFYHVSNVRAGLKGEGTTDTTFAFMRGKGRNINGGGGGNARLAGGGGGSNFGGGGRGGEEATSSCDSVIATGGLGGYDLGRIGWYYVNNNQPRGNRIFFGGGGGTGTKVAGRTTTGGGDGGGVVVIVADTIVGNGRSIVADGDGVTGVADGAGGGGGGGGCIVLDVSGYEGTLNLSAVGGDGGDTNHPSDTTGPGGGGGGGIYWLAGNDISQTGVAADLISKGENGEYLATSYPHGASDGDPAFKRNGLEAPIKGFIFNPVPTEFTVCSDINPGQIQASEPKGGSGTYTYEWIDSSRVQNSWQPAPGINNQKNYIFTAPLADTTWFRRIVTDDSGVLLPDTSFRIAYYVHPEITGNIVTAPDTVCSGDAPNSFTSSAALGGGPTGGDYDFLWVQKEEGGGFTPAGGPNTGETYQAPGLTITTQFAREVRSGVCVDTSAPLLVKVWEQLSDNAVTPFDTICYNTVPEELSGPVPSGGDPSDIRYQWERADGSGGPWNEIGGAQGRMFQPPALTQTRWFRRVVRSGSDDACVDASDPVEILNIPLITGNTISETQTVCTGTQPGQLTGSVPGGGYQDQYSYRWESRTLSTGWGPADGDNDVQTGYDPGVMTGDTTFYRRVVGSGGTARNVCRDTSSQLAINVLPPITNNLITTAGPVQCQNDRLASIIQDVSGGPTPGGGATQGGSDPTRSYRWEEATGADTPGSWQILTGETEINYEAQPVADSDLDRWYRRIVYSGGNQECIDTSNLQRVTVHTQITGNSITAFDSVCYASTKVLEGSTPAGESGLDPVYTWRDLDAGANIPGSGQENYTAGPYNALGTYNYERVVAIGECTDTSNTMSITVMQLPGGRLTDAPFKACERDTALAIDLTIDRLNTAVTPWEVYLDNGVDFEPVGPYSVEADGTLEVTLETGADSMDYNYTIASIVYRSVGERYECTAPPDSISGNVPVEVFRKPDPQILVDQEARDSFKVCNTTAQLSVDADNGTGYWSSDPSGSVFFTPDPAAEQISATIPNNHEAFGKYTLTFRSQAGDCHGEDRIDLHFFEQPAPAYAGEDTMIFLKNSVQLEADPPTAGTGIWEVVAGNGTIVDEHAPSTIAYELALGEENRFRWTVTNGEDEGMCVTSSDVVIVIRNEVKRYQGFSPNGDMDNEYFIMRGLKYADRFSITFFNALGRDVRVIDQTTIQDLEVDETLIASGLGEDELVVWDGLNNDGSPLPSGTYYYYVEFQIDQRDPVTGNIIRTDSYDYGDYVVLMRD